MFFLKNRLARRYDPVKEAGPGHPVYERVKAEYEAQARAKANDPENIKQIQASIDRKVAQWRAEFEAEWRAEKEAEARGGEA